MAKIERVLSRVVLVLAVTIAGGCRIEIAVPEGGKVLSESGNHECLSGNICNIDVDDFSFSQTFNATPDGPDYLFSHWRKRPRGLCGGQAQPCAIDASRAADHPNLIDILYSDQVFYLEPVFSKPDTWVKSGSDMPGESVGDYAGRSLSLSADGTRVVFVTGRYPAVKVITYRWSGLDWQRDGEDLGLGDNGYTHDAEVYLSANGKRLAVFYEGTLRVYLRADMHWKQIGRELTHGTGAALSADGHRVAIGGIFPDEPVAQESEISEMLLTARVYDWSGGDWQQLGADIISEEPLGEVINFGKSLSLSADGSRLALSVPRCQGGPYVRAFHWSNQEWQQLGSNIHGEDLDCGGDYQQTVAFSADGFRLAVGAPSGSYDNSAGLVRVYQWTEDDWQLLGSDISAQGARNYTDFFGSAISLAADGSRVAIGAPRDDSHGEWSGLVQVYGWSGSRWRQLGGSLEGDAPAEKVGTAVSLSSDGQWLAVSAHASNRYIYQAGYVSVYLAPIKQAGE